MVKLDRSSVIEALRSLMRPEGTQRQENIIKANAKNLGTPMTAESTPINLSTVPSSADLLTLNTDNRRRREGLVRHVSECVSELPLPRSTRIKDCCRSWLSGLARLPALLLLLYMFICSLDFLSTSFRLIAGKAAGSVFQESELLSNPVVGLMIGVFFTVLVQSSSTCTSVIVSMVSSGILDVHRAIPMVMGANIGTSLTNTLVSLTQVANKDQFERAFAGATVHDCFNWLTVIVLLTCEVAFGYLYKVTFWLTHTNAVQQGGSAAGSATNAMVGVNLLGDLTKPLTKSVVQIDKKVLKCWALGECQDERLLKVWCKKPANVTTLFNGTDGLFNETMETEGERCSFLFNIESLSDVTIGIILLVISLLLVSLCLILIVKLLRSLLQGTVAEMIRKTINADIPYFPWLTGYIAILMGAILTFIVQSSSVFTSTLTPLVGVGLITVERVYPLTLGSNLGTTTTALLASMAADDPVLAKNSIQIALCHLLFNLSGLLLFYPIPAMRWPLKLCKVLGRTTARYRWFAFMYLLMMFFILPGSILALSMAGQIPLLIVLAPTAVIVTLAVIINVIQDNHPKILPEFLQNWDFLPLCLHSLEPYDAVIQKINCCMKYDMVPEHDPRPPATIEPIFEGIVVS